MTEQRQQFAAELRQVAKDVEAGTVSLEHAASLLLVVSVRMEQTKPALEPAEQCGQCGAEVLGCHACPGVPGWED